MRNVLVVGSGLSGYAVIKEILSNNNRIKITLIDNSNIEKLNLPKNYLKEKKMAKGFGKENKYRSETTNTFIYYSNFFGGLSNLWSGASLPYGKNFYNGLNVRNKIGKYYKRVFNNFSFKYDTDFFFKKYVNLKSNSKEKIDNNLCNIFFKKFKNSKNYDLGKSIIMKKDETNSNSNTLVYDTKSDLLKLIKNKSLKYLSNHELLSFAELKNKVNVKLKNKNRIIKKNFDKIYIASGSINTTKIVADSLSIDTPINIKETRGFRLPIFFKGKKYLTNYIHGLPEIFIKDKKNPDNIFFQISYDPYLIIDYLKNSFFLFKLVPNIILEYFTKKSLIVWGFLESNNTNLKLYYNYKDKKYSLRTTNNKIDKNLITKFVKNFNDNDFFIFNFLVKVGKFGESNHYGSSFPMSSDKIGLYSDEQGRPMNLKNVHIVDSSILPDIKPGPISFEVISNAMRIANETSH